MASRYLNKKFVIDTLDRAVATFAQGALSVLTLGATSVLDVDFLQVGSVAALASLISVLTSISLRGQASAEETADTETNTSGEGI